MRLIGLAMAIVALSALASATVPTDRALYPIVVRNRWGFIDRSGQVVVPPRYESILTAFDAAAEERSEDRFMAASVVPETTEIVAVRFGGKWGFVDHAGQLLPLRFDDVGPFQDGMAAARLGTLWGFVSTRALIAVPPTFEAVTGFLGGVAVVRQDFDYGAIDPDGRFVIKPRFEMIRPADSVFFDNRALVITSGKKGYVSRAGTIAVPAQFDEALPFSEGLAAVTRGGQTGFIDTSGRMVIRPRPWIAESFSRGRAVVSVNGKHGYIDRTGAFVVEPQFNQALAFTSDDEALAWKGETRGVVDLSGRWSVPAFDERQRLNDSLSVAVVGGRLGLVRRVTGDLLREYRWREVGLFREGLAGVRGSNGRFGFIDVDGRVVIAPRFRRVGSFAHGLCKATTRDTVGYIDAGGEWVWSTRSR